MSNPPARFKSLEELTPSEHAERQEAQRRGRPEPKFETDEYREARAELLTSHGFEEATPDPDPGSEDPETHARRKYGDAA